MLGAQLYQLSRIDVTHCVVRAQLYQLSRVDVNLCHLLNVLTMVTHIQTASSQISSNHAGQ